MKIRGRRIPLTALAFPLFFVAVFTAAWFSRDLLYSLFASSERLRAAVEESGAWAPLVFVILQTLQVVIFMIPGEVAQIAGGYLFGVLEGTILSVIGIALGSLVDFTAARLLGKRFVASLFGEDTLSRFDAIRTSPRAEAVFFLLFVIPGIPKDLLCFIAGLSAMRPFGFLAVSMVGRLPGIVGSSVMGAAAADGRGGLFIGAAIVAAVLFVAGIAARDRIHTVLSAFAAYRSPLKNRRRRSAAGEPEPRPEGDGTPRTKDT